jgi:hypothetical protein
MKIKLQEALDLIEGADVVKLIGNNGTYFRPNVFVELPKGDPSNEIIYLSWDDQRDEFCIRATEGENTEVERDGHMLTMIDDEGEPFKLELFREVPILP